jgi:hypothetical protein
MRGPLEYLSVQAEIYCRVNEVILKNNGHIGQCYIIYSDLKKAPIRFYLNRWENGKCNSSSPKTRKGSHLDIKLFVFYKKFNSVS